jgi:hypothetical protein
LQSQTETRYTVFNLVNVKETSDDVIKTNAKVAQLVEHDLAKVGVASSNLVFTRRYLFKRLTPAQMVELVDTQDLKSCDLKSRAGSIPALSTAERLS